MDTNKLIHKAYDLIGKINELTEELMKIEEILREKLQDDIKISEE